MTNLQYMLYSFAAALMKAGESLKESADNVPAGVGNGAPDADGVVSTGQGVTAGTGELLNTNPPQVDSRGIKWDERIHSGGKSIKQDGTWTWKKGIKATDAIVTQVESEQRAATGGTGAAPTQQLQGLGVQLPGLSSLTALPGGAPQLNNYQKLVAYVAANSGPGKKVDDAWVQAALAQMGTSLPALAANEEAAAFVLAEFQKVLG